MESRDSQIVLQQTHLWPSADGISSREIANTMSLFSLTLVAAWSLCGQVSPEPPALESELIFPLRQDHNHAPGIVACADGTLVASWYRGSGERTADDVAVYGSRRRPGSRVWEEPFVMVDTPGFPDCNTCLMLDRQQRLWLFWPIILANSWESCVTNYRVASQFTDAGPPHWERSGQILLKPENFQAEATAKLEETIGRWPDLLKKVEPAELKELRTRIDSKLYQRLGWQPRCKPTVLPNGRIVFPLYSDTYSASIMALSDDGGETWYASKPLLGWGNIQPAVVRRNDGTLVAYMRENGFQNRIRVAESRDDGMTWGEVGNSDLPNPGSGLDGVRLNDGHWLLVYNDSAQDRRSLAVSISADEGRTWPWTRHLERAEQGSYHYPAVIQDLQGTVHVVYSYFVAEGKSMKHAAFSPAWVRQSE
jgi:predicted neuraminidase